MENVRRDERDGDAAQRAAGGHHQVIGGEIAGRRLEAGELAVAEQADAEHRGEVYEQCGAEADFDLRAFGRGDVVGALSSGVVVDVARRPFRCTRPVMPHL